jgi:hypothetical protein
MGVIQRVKTCTECHNKIRNLFDKFQGRKGKSEYIVYECINKKDFNCFNNFYDWFLENYKY